tara:strand:- start:906 stop:1670 length:765 start_codon:yes stop_codon:yes gene_type:complete
MSHKSDSFQEYKFAIKDNYFKYYLSPILKKHNFKHGFFTKTSSEIDLSLFSNHLKINNINCILDQKHSNKIVLGSKTERNERVEADGIIGNKNNQNLWIYTADCMPILFADKRKRLVAAIHCGRKGLENKIIKNLIQILVKKGCSNEDILVAIGPSISKKNYLIDNKTLQNFYRNATQKEASTFFNDKKRLSTLKKQDLIPLNLKKYAHIQLLSENIPNKNINISNLCTYESSHDFYSWRRFKTFSRQWNFISA